MTTILTAEEHTAIVREHEREQVENHPDAKYIFRPLYKSEDILSPPNFQVLTVNDHKPMGMISMRYDSAHVHEIKYKWECVLFIDPSIRDEVVTDLLEYMWLISRHRRNVSVRYTVAVNARWIADEVYRIPDYGTLTFDCNLSDTWSTSYDPNYQHVWVDRYNRKEMLSVFKTLKADRSPRSMESAVYTTILWNHKGAGTILYDLKGQAVCGILFKVDEQVIEVTHAWYREGTLEMDRIHLLLDVLSKAIFEYGFRYPRTIDKCRITLPIYGNERHAVEQFIKLMQPVRCTFTGTRSKRPIKVETKYEDTSSFSGITIGSPTDC